MDLAEKTVNKDEDIKAIYNLEVSYDLLDNLTFRSVTGVDYSSINGLYAEPSNGWSAVYFEDANNAGLGGSQQYQQTNIFFN
jgi:hypothetical protein